MSPATVHVQLSHLAPPPPFEPPPPAGTLVHISEVLGVSASTQKLASEAGVLYRDVKAKAKQVREAAAGLSSPAGLQMSTHGTDKRALLLVGLLLVGTMICIAVGLRGLFGYQSERGSIDESESLQLSPTHSTAIGRRSAPSVRLRVLLEVTEIACEFHAALAPEVLDSMVSCHVSHFSICTCQPYRSGSRPSRLSALCAL